MLVNRAGRRVGGGVVMISIGVGGGVGLAITIVAA